MFEKKDDKHVGPNVDIWALGVTMFYMLTGKYPHSDSTDLEDLQDRITSIPINLSSINNTAT
jgi:serine/threonine protein kinase